MTHTTSSTLPPLGHEHHDHDPSQISSTRGADGAPLPVYDTQEIAAYLTDGFWQDRGSVRHHFNVEAGDSLRVDLTALGQYGMTAAREALEAWTNVSGLNFEEVSSGSSRDILFTEDKAGAYANATYAGNTTLSATVNIHSDWAMYGAYYDQVYIHEVGHALGLGHAGNYNGGAEYQTDAHYANDSWQATVMSYFDQRENTYVDASRLYLLTPQIADIAAIQELYGQAIGVNSDDTTYGDGATGHLANSLSSYRGIAIYDGGGIDTIDLGSRGYHQRLDLRAGHYSDITGARGNFSIAEGVVIENAVTGFGNDTVTGNSADNIISTGEGQDLLFGGTGEDTLDGGLGDDFIDGGEGRDIVTSASAAADLLLDFSGDNPMLHTTASNSIDTLVSIEVLRVGATDYDMNSLRDAFDALGATGPTPLRDLANYKPEPTPQPSDREVNLEATEGDDDLVTAADTESIYGMAGNDTYTLASATTRVGELEGDGYDVIFIDDSYDLAAMTTGVEELVLTGTLNHNGSGDHANNVLRGNSGQNVLDGRGGDDMLYGGAGIDTFLPSDGADISYGGTGDDVYWIDNTADRVRELVGEGHDSVFSSVDFDLEEHSAYLEDLYLTGSGDISGRGNNYGNLISGNTGDNDLYGGAGNDTIAGDFGDDNIEGGSGADRLIGGADSDSFIFREGAGQDTISDFDLEQDLIWLATEMNFDALDITATQDGARITHDDNSILLDDIAASALTADHFVFF